MTERLTDERKQQIRERAEWATPGPWKIRPRWPLDIVLTEYGETTIGSTERGMHSEVKNEANAEFIAAARTDIPDLLAEVETLTARVGELEHCCDGRMQKEADERFMLTLGCVREQTGPNEWTWRNAKAESAERRVSELVAQNQGLVEERERLREALTELLESHCPQGVAGPCMGKKHTKARAALTPAAPAEQPTKGDHHE